MGMSPALTNKQNQCCEDQDQELGSAFTLWCDRVVKCFKDLYKDGVFCNFTVLSFKFSPLPSYLFCYFQITNCAKSQFPMFPAIAPKQMWGKLLCSDVH